MVFLNTLNHSSSLKQSSSHHPIPNHFDQNILLPQPPGTHPHSNNFNLFDYPFNSSTSLPSDKDDQEDLDLDSQSDLDSLSSPSFLDDNLVHSAPSIPLQLIRLANARQQPLLRHGFDNPSLFPHYLNALALPHATYWDNSPYKNINPTLLTQIPFWSQPLKHRTVCAALFLCLRLGFDPPDIVKTDPAPRLEAWTDPQLLPKESVLESIAKRLKEQFESLAPTHARVKFKTYPDVYAEEFKKTLVGLRKYSQSDRCLVYYNGHGVPKPTPTGEIWVFNKLYTQYIPISLADILTWVGPPVIFIWDCNHAGQILNCLILAAQKKDQALAIELAQQHRPTTPSPPPPPLNNSQPRNLSLNPIALPDHHGSASGRTSPSIPRSSLPPPIIQNPSLKFADTIQLAACQPDEMLPLDPNLPADVFTSCLTSPIEMALRFYVLRNNSQHSKWTTTADFFDDLLKLDKVPGRMEMRRTPLGELTWIFTSIADAIAWNHLDRDLFTKIFRGDLVLAGTFRGFLLAERVLRSYGCTPLSSPKLPSTHHSELWQCWDLEVDMCLSQLLEIWKSEAVRAEWEAERANRPPNTLPPQIVTYKPSSFFSQQLTAFEVWLKAVVAENPEENGERDEDHLRRKDTLQWCCNDWSGVKFDKIDHSDFACHDPSGPGPKSTRYPSLNGRPKKNAPLSPTRPASPGPDGGPSCLDPPPERPIRYKLPTYIKHFPLNSRKPDDLYPPSPPQLPIVLQVLLSPLHRLRALILLCRLMDLGPWAVHLSLSIGIFQYVLKLLQAPAAELKPVLIFIWARILTVYPDGRLDLFRVTTLRPNSHGEAPIEYFIKIMAPHSMELPVVNVVDHKAMCAFILSIGCKNMRLHAQRLMQLGVLEIVVHRLKELAAWQRQWYIILLAHMWEQSDFVKGRAVKMGVNTVLSDLLTDKVPEVRTAALYAFGTLIGASTSAHEPEVEDEFPEGGPSPRPLTQAGLACRLSAVQSNRLNSFSASNPAVSGFGYQEQISIEVGSAMACCHCSGDGSPMFRQELVVVLSALVDQHLGHFIVAAYEFARQQEQEKQVRLAEALRKYREEQERAWLDGLETGFEKIGLENGGGNPMTDRTAKLEKLIRKLKADEELEPAASLRPYLWMEFSNIYIVLLDLTLDPANEVAEMARSVVDYLHSRLVDSVLGRWLELDELMDEAAEQAASSTEREARDEANRGSAGKRSSASNLSKQRSSGSLVYPAGRTGGLASNLSSASVFQSLSTVNSLVPSFVKPAGWKTPFSGLSRSPEQSTFAGPAAPSLGSREGSRTGLRKSASLTPLVSVQSAEDVPGDDEGRGGAADARAERLARLAQGTLESVIANTRAADHTRRQLGRSYVFANPLWPGTADEHPAPVRPATRNAAQVGEDEQEAEARSDYLFFLGLQHEEELKEDNNSSEDGRPRPLPLRSKYYELSAHTFLKPKMTSSVSENEDQVVSSSGFGTSGVNSGGVKKVEECLGGTSTGTGTGTGTVTTTTTGGVREVVGGGTGQQQQQHGEEEEEEEGLEGIKCEWRKIRNAKVVLEAEREREVGLELGKKMFWDKLVCSFNNNHNNQQQQQHQSQQQQRVTGTGTKSKNSNKRRPITNLLMHQFEDQCICSDGDGLITVYDWRRKVDVNRFMNSSDDQQQRQSQRPSWITSMELINQESVGLLLASTGDGNVRIFRGYDRPGETSVVTAFKGLPNHEPSTQAEAGTVTNWQQAHGQLLVGGNAREMGVWSARRESVIEGLKTRASSCMTALSSDQVTGQIICAGFGDGSVRIYDRRLPRKRAMVQVYRGIHGSWVSSIKMQLAGSRELVSGDTIGNLVNWDIRFEKPIRVFRAHQEGMPSMDLHEQCSLVASGSMNGTVKIWDLNSTNSIDSTITRRTSEVEFEGGGGAGGLSERETMGSLVSKISGCNENGGNSGWVVGLGNGVGSSSNSSYGIEGMGGGIGIGAGGGASGPVTRVCFHPYKLMVSVAKGDDGMLSVYECEK